MEEEKKQELKEKLIPLYASLLKEVKSNEKDLSPFCIQWGKSFPDQNNHGIIFVGKATNGSISDCSVDVEVDTLFNESFENRIFAKKVQMNQWKEFREGNNNGYNTKKSSFWRVIRGVTQSIYEQEKWSEEVAWSNLYKIAPSKRGNPSSQLRKTQLPLCVEILKVELETFQPQFVVLFTSAWEKDFLYHLNGSSTKSIDKYSWNAGKSEIKVFKINQIYFIATKHPQGKPEQEHINLLSKIIKKYQDVL